ncbi:hypothetical protein PLICRDRAFT_451963 [Plicaturopsis crispa FD-325 SS-3]|uniref:Uncharacterized protein n=1 Tax=Plicaturopsis crispa FD-325 SS-3 TaxID=944288 RepID=A0A0C9SKA4_PLICR|nr:hypothetical protein PLICRDRAFT_451963 [Plicaturopsis crispa FD-325 SS-3]
METPTLILDDSTVWPEDSWTGGAICLSMVRDFECNGPPPPRAVEAPAPAPQRTLKAADVQALIAHVGKRYAGVTEDVPMFADVDGGSRPDDAKVLDFIACADRRASEAMLNVVPPSIDVESAPARPDPLSRGSEHESRTSGRGAETGTMDTLAPFHLDQGPCNGPLPSFTEFMEISCPDDLNAPASDVACDNLSSNGPASSVIPRNWQQSALYGVDSYGPAGDDELRLNMDSTREPLPPIYDESPFCPVRVPPNVVEPPVADLAVKLENPSFAPFLYSFHGDAHVLPSVHAAHTEDERPNSMAPSSPLILSRGGHANHNSLVVLQR